MRPGDLSSEALYRVYLILEILRSTGEREFPMQLASVFMWIASHDGCLQEEIQTATTLSSSSVSRNVSWLGPTHRLGRDGLHLIRRERDYKNPKAWRIYLTPKGVQFKNLIEQALTGPVT